MAKKTAPLMPATDELLQRFGERLRLARRRRRLASKHVAERAGMAPMTLRSLERGGSGVTMGAYLAVMQVLGIERDLDMLGQADPLGRELQDSRFPTGRAHVAVSRAQIKQQVEVSAPQRLGGPPVLVRQAGTAAPIVRQRAKPADDAGAWTRDSGFTSARSLANLIKPRAPVPKKRRG